MSSTSAPQVCVRALGPLRVSVDQAGAPALTQPRRLALVAYLTLAEPRGPHARDTLVALLWPEATAEHARQALRNSLHEIRKALGDDVVVTAGKDLVSLDPARVACDVDALEADLAAGRVDDAIARYAEPLSGFHVSGAPEFERWADGVRHAFRSRVTHAALAASQERLAAGDGENALRLARVAQALDPDDERMLRRCLELMTTGGDLAGARRAYRTFAARLAAEYDAEPAAETTALMERLAHAAPAPGTRGGAAYVLYVRGTYLFLRAAHVGGRPEDLHQSREFFEQALALDPELGSAVAGLSNYFAACAARTLLQPFAEHFGRAIALSERALALDPTLAIPHVHFGVQAMYLDHDWERAGRELRRAVTLDPYYAEARRFLGIQLGATGDRAQGVRELREAARMEPQIPMFHNSLGDALLAAGAYDEAIAALRAALRLDPGFRAARERLVRAYERTDRWEDAVAQRRLAGPPEAAESFARALADGGAAGYRRARDAELRAQIARLAERAGRPAEHPADLFTPPELQLALAHAELGEWAEAFAWEERAAARHPGLRPWFRGRPELDRLASWRSA